MSITYFCTDQDGNSYTRHSAGHTEPRYTHAVVRRPIGQTAPASHKSHISYAGSRALAQKAAEYNWPSWGKEIVAVRAYPGRHKVEPTAQAEARAADRIADRIDGYDRDDLGESPDF